MDGESRRRHFGNQDVETAVLLAVPHYEGGAGMALAAVGRLMSFRQQFT